MLKNVTKAGLCLLAALFAASTSTADTPTFWSIELPVMEGARNIERVEELSFALKRISYNIDIETTDEIYDFYDRYFENLGWENPAKHSSFRGREKTTKWSGFSMYFDEDGMPVASYGSIWIPKDIPARGSTNVTLSGYSEGLYSASVDVSIAPEVDTTPLMKLQQLLGDEPRNFFILSKLVKGNPFEIDKIEIPDPSLYDGDEPLIEEYLEIVQQIMKGFSQFAEQYITQ